MERWILFAVCWLCGAIFLGIGLYAVRRKTPMNFWSGETVPSESVSDIPAYNRAMGKLWGGYGVVYWVAGPIGFWHPIAGVVVMCVLSVIGAAALVLIYKKIIEKKYRIK